MQKEHSSYLHLLLAASPENRWDQSSSDPFYAEKGSLRKCGNTIRRHIRLLMETCVPEQG